MGGRVRLVLLDVNETLVDLAPLRQRLADVGAPPELHGAWFAGTLRDGSALALTGAAAPFADVARGVLRTVLLPHVPRERLDAAVQHVLDGFPGLPLHPDVAPGLRRLHAEGVRLVTLTNGSAALSARLLDGVGGLVEARLSVDGAGRWKPHPRAYAWALEQVDVPPDRAALVAVHPWDLAGARVAGLLTGHLDRAGGPWPEVFPGPDVRAGDLPGLAEALLSL